MTNQSSYMRSFDDAVPRVVRQAAKDVPAFADRLVEANLTPSDVTSVSDLNRLPILAKDGLLELQRKNPPFGGLVAPGTAIRRVFQSPGPIYEPQFAIADHWGAAPALRAAGIGKSDLVLNCFGYHLTPAGALFEEACFSVGATVIPGGIGSKDLQAAAVADLGVTAYIGTPSYLKALEEFYSSSGLDPARWRIERALVAAEPLPPSLRDALSRRVSRVQMAYGTAETGILAYEETPGEGLRVRDDALVQICDLDTGEPIAEGEGQIVVTLMRPDYPLVRFGTGDISAWANTTDGKPELVGILGRVGQGVKVRGMFLHPAQIDRVLKDEPGVDAYRMVVERRNHKDELRCEVVLNDVVASRTLLARLTDRIRSGLRFSADVVPVEELRPDASVIDDRRAWD